MGPIMIRKDMSMQKSARNIGKVYSCQRISIQNCRKSSLEPKSCALKQGTYFKTTLILIQTWKWKI